MPVKVDALDHLVINVTDVARTADWYHRILGMEVKVFDHGGGKARRTSLQFGQQKINVRRALPPPGSNTLTSMPRILWYQSAVRATSVTLITR